jgi:hypothetical protein
MAEQPLETEALAHIDVLVVVDAVAAASTGNLGNNVYMVDTNKHFGSGNEGQAELYTACHDNQTINWRVAGVSPSSDVKISGFTGQLIDGKICMPEETGIVTDRYWSGVIQARGEYADYQYSIVVRINDTDYTFDPFVRVTK